MKNVIELTRRAAEYAEHYRRLGANEETVQAIYVSHLAYLLSN